MTAFFTLFYYTLNKSFIDLKGKIPLTIYLDMIFLLNLFCNWMILLLTKLLVRTDTKWYRILLGSIFASLLVPLTLYFPHSIFTSVLGKLAYSILIVWCTFGVQSLHNMGRKLFVFYFVSFAIGGERFAISVMLQYSILDTDILSPNYVYIHNS